MTTAPIGVFDSGVGGLSVLRAIRAELPGEHLLYVADSAYAPYGDKSEQFVMQRSLVITEFLLRQDAKTIVVACNTATSAAVATLRERFRIPIVGMEPAVKPALTHTRSGVIGVLATGGTVASDKFANLLARIGGDGRILVQPCPGLVEAVESGELTGPATYSLIEQYLTPLVQSGVDTLVLGCTHYPFLRKLIEAIAGPTVTVVDPSPAVARELRRRLTDSGLLSDATHGGTERFWSSDSPPRAERVISQLWERNVTVAHFTGT